MLSRMLVPQLWPHSHHSLAYVSKWIKYGDLSLVEFFAGYAAILQPQFHPIASSHFLLSGSFQVIGWNSGLRDFAPALFWCISLPSTLKAFGTQVVHCGLFWDWMWSGNLGWFVYMFGISCLTISVAILSCEPTRSDSSPNVFFCRD